MTSDPHDAEHDFEEDSMARLSDSLPADLHDVPPGGQQIRRGIEGKFVCPFCGTVNERTDEPCPKCGMENTPATRNNTRARVGPWYVLQQRNPSAPGMKFDTLLNFIRKGRVGAKAIVRGPSTSQLWRFAATIKGLSREFGLCYNCGGDIDKHADICPHCGRNQLPPAEPDMLVETRAGGAPAPLRNGHRNPAPEEMLQNGETTDVDLESELPPAAPVKPRPIGKKVAVPVSPAPTPVSPAAPAAPVFKPRIDPEELARREAEAARMAREREPRDPNKQSPTLSARELATAFQLGFKDDGGRRRGKRKSRKGLLFVLFLLALGGAGTAAWFKVPQFHDGVLEAYTRAQLQIQQWTNSTAKPTNVNSPAPAGQSALPQVINTPGLSPAPAKQVIPPPRMVVPSPTATKSPEVTPAPTNPTVTNPNVTPAQSATPAPAPPAVVTPPAPKVTLDEAYDLERKLWRQALDCEANNDYAGAVTAYQQIKALPQKAWPSSLQMRLDDAQTHLR